MKCLDCNSEKIYCKQRCSKCYSRLPENKEKRKKYYQRLEVKKRIKKYKERPEQIIKSKKYLIEYNQKKENKQKRKEYYKIPEVKEKKRIYDLKPENIKKRSILYKINNNNNKPKIKLRRKNYLRGYNQKIENKQIRKKQRERPEFIEKQKNRAKKYYKKTENRKRRNKRTREYTKKRRKNDLGFRLISNLRTRNRIAFGGLIKEQTCLESLGCNKEFFKQHLINQFDKNMTVENYGTYWHIDHIIPLRIAKTGEEVQKLNHYTNLRPLYWKDNLEKGGKLDWKLE